MISNAILAGVLATAAWFGALGCMSRPRESILIESDPPIQVVYLERLNTLRPGMSHTAVGAKLDVSLREAGRKERGGGHIDAYELSKERLMASGQKRTEYLWFYFKDDALIRWGPPGDWPVIEKNAATEAAPVATPNDANAPASPPTSSPQ
jgi:hypothetical protein